jgi:hypothetical protein
MRFLDPQKPIYTCEEKDCAGCDVKNDVTCHFTQGQLFKFLLLAFPAFILGGVGAFLYAWWALAIFIVLILAYFLFTEIRVMCSHCPHYAEPDTKTLTCWANYGAPKIWKYRPGPMSFLEKTVFLVGMFIVFLSPALFMILGGRFILMYVYLAYTLFGFIMLLTFLCTRCMNFACPFNRTNKDVRKKFFAHNPKVDDAWNNTKKERL